MDEEKTEDFLIFNYINRASLDESSKGHMSVCLTLEGPNFI
jgi:hypothetical protein